MTNQGSSKWSPDQSHFTDPDVGHTQQFSAVPQQQYGQPEEYPTSYQPQQPEKRGGPGPWRALMSVSSDPITTPPKFRGFKVNDYSDTSAIVSLAAEYTNGVVATMPVQLSHNSGDWKVVLPNQEQAPDLTEITEEELAADFTPFGPEEN